MEYLMTWVFMMVFLCQTAPSNGDTFEDRASVMLSLVEKKLPITECIHRAEENANKFNLTGDTHYAVLWINMYSLNCILDWKLNNLPFKLNKELWCKYFNQSDPEILSLFLSVSSVIDEALKFLKPRQFKQLFRGVQIDWPFVNRTLVIEDGFFSSSTDIDDALQYAQGQILLVIQELNGVDIATYVNKYYLNLKEVLVNSGKIFKIERKLTDNQEINDFMSDFKGPCKNHLKNPKVVLFIREINASQQVKNKVLNEQKHLLDETCSDQTSNLSMIGSFIGHMLEKCIILLVTVYTVRFILHVLAMIGIVFVVGCMLLMIIIISIPILTILMPIYLFFFCILLVLSLYAVVIESFR